MNPATSTEPTTAPIEIRCYDFPDRWLVKSRRNEDRYLVDLAEHNRLGECGCDGFQIPCQVLLKQGLPPNRRCFHIRYVRQHLQILLATAFPEIAERTGISGPNATERSSSLSQRPSAIEFEKHGRRAQTQKQQLTHR